MQRKGHFATGVLVTLEPLPFANAEGPLKLLASDCSPAPHTDPTSHSGEAQAPSAQPEMHAHSPSKSTAAPGDTPCIPADTMLYFRGPAKLRAIPLRRCMCLSHDVPIATSIKQSALDAALLTSLLTKTAMLLSL